MKRLNAHDCFCVWTVIQSCLELDFHLDLEKREGEGLRNIIAVFTVSTERFLSSGG